ncbi:MAG: hypothetical protein PHD15_04755 [Clostridia bacterium]|nr:hypothetical protein [Clostridia bacterium]MDD4387049.1 hypothetical protein [Clostridia bacterium]
MELFVIGIIVIYILFIVAFIIPMFKKNDVDEEKKMVENKSLSMNQVAISFLIVSIGIIFNVISMPIIIIVAILLKIYKVQGEFVTAYYKGLKVLLIVYLVALIAFGLCMALYIL